MAKEEPHDLKPGIKRFETFHKLDPKRVGPFDSKLKIPTNAVLIGHAAWVTYRSNKWYGGTESYSYIHEHDDGVKLYKPGLARPQTPTPEFLRNAETLVRLGTCEGFAYKEDDEEIKIKAERGSELYCTPNGRALLVIWKKRTLVALMWGGKLDVLDKGIVG